MMPKADLNPTLEMHYKVIKSETISTRTGSSFKKATIEAEGVTLEVSVWPDYSKYADVLTGNTVEGLIREKGQYKNLVDGNLGFKPPYLRQNSPITKAVTEKAKSIEVAQERKGEAIMAASTIRMATDIVVAQGVEGKGDVEIQDAIESWRRWFIDNWEIK